ncbi:MAG: hypothetical protein ACP5MD_13400 [Verrucomicrobiia bacterium]
MYPRQFFDTYWRGDLKREVFVAMPFNREFDKVWSEAIRPAIDCDLDVGNSRFVAHRVDTSAISDSIHREILDGIAHATLVFVDISVMRTGAWKGQWNGNVMFELGIAQTVRPASDLVVVKSDSELISFDINHIRVHQYNQADLSEARRKFAQLLSDALKQREQEKSLRTQRLRERLDVDSMNLMVKVCPDGKNFVKFSMNGYSAEERRIAIRLLDLGIFRCVCTGRRQYHYEWTDFGKYCYLHPQSD